jgi:hypothetical protein
MQTSVPEGMTIEEHLETALETAENGDTKYHIRESLQKLQASEW